MIKWPNDFINKIILGNCLDIMKKIPDNSVDLILTDPAYESLEKWRNMGTTTRLGGNSDINKQNKDMWFNIFSNKDLPELMKQSYRILKDNRHCYFMCDFETLILLYDIAIKGNIFKSKSYGGVYKSCKPLIWDKVKQGMGYTYRARYEFIFMLWKGKKRKLNNLSIPDILSFPRIDPRTRLYPTEKPLGLFELLIEQSTQKDEIVIDPFIGSGVTSKACVNLNRKYIGIDISEKACNLAKKG